MKNLKKYDDSDGGMAGQLLGLSLFIMLLAFFIVLNAISVFEAEKVKPAMESLGNTFGSKVDINIDTGKPSEIQHPDKSIHEGSTVEKIEALFSAQIPGYKITINKSRGEMYLKIPFDVFEQAVMALGQENALVSGEAERFGRYFLPTLVALLKKSGMEYQYRLDMLYNIKGNAARLQRKNARKLDEYIREISVIVGRIEEAGLPSQFMSAGLTDGDSGQIELFFRRHVTYNPEGEE